MNTVYTFSLIVVLFLLQLSCTENFDKDDIQNACAECRLDISSSLLKDENGIYQLDFNPDLAQTYTTLKAETNCGWSQRLMWDSDYQYQISPGEWVNLVNPSSMTDEDGVGQIVFSVWEDFIGYTITVICGYTDNCENHYLDSLKIYVNG